MQRHTSICFLIAGVLILGLRAVHSAETLTKTCGEQPSSWIIPRPQCEKIATDVVTLAHAGGEIGIRFASAERRPATLTSGLRLLADRVQTLGCTIRETQADGNQATIVFEKFEPETMAAILAAHGVTEVVEPARLAQAYNLVVTDDANGRVTVRASGNLGLYYGIVSLVQLIDSDPKGSVSIPAGQIVDWPEIAHRLAKTSATENVPALVRRFAALMPLYKISQVGLQFHGARSLKPDHNFTTTVPEICGWARRSGICETIIYFCPFRGAPTTEAYDFRLPEHKAAYAQLLQGFLAAGAHGIEVDYNDWPGSPETPIEDVINMACEAVWKKDPTAYVLYCAPHKGTSQYRGPASPEMKRILSKLPTRVWPLWTGEGTLITKPLQTETVHAWTDAAGRRPFLWVNRVSLGVPHEFGRPAGEVPGIHVFQGELLPKDLNRLFEGVHFNAGMGEGYNKLPNEFTTEAIAYFATAADFVWNPGHWDAAESCRRARRFAEIMLPLLK